MKLKIYQFIIKFNDAISTISADSLEEAMVSLQNSLQGEKRAYNTQLAGIFNAEDYSKLLKLSTVLIEPPKLDSLEAMAEMLKNNGYEVKKS